MAKWFDETVLIRYWEERCTRYRLKRGVGIERARRNPAFGKYPDISQNYLRDGSVVPAEIEWVTTNFERHGHDIRDLIDNDGFLIVFRSDASFLVEQIEVDRDDFVDWFAEKARELVLETLQDVDRQAGRSKEPQVFLYYVPRTGRGKANLEIALEHGVWGFPESDRRITRGMAAISEIKRHDIVVVVHDFRADPSVGARGGRLPREKYVGEFELIMGLVVTRGLYRDDDRPIWSDQQYPHRFDFRPAPLFIGRGVPCAEKSLGASLYETLRRLQVNGSVQKIDGSSMTKLMSLCIR